MKYVCFTGHRSIDANGVMPLLEKVIKECLMKGIRVFYSAEAGDFDNLVIKTLKKFKKEFQDINVIALHGKNKQEKTRADESTKLNSFAAEFKKIILESDCLICFVSELGCAFKLMQFAIQNSIKVINIAED